MAFRHISEAESSLGAMTVQGRGCEANIAEGIGYYLMAAEDGDVTAYNMLKSLTKPPESENDKLGLNKPWLLLGKAQQGDTKAMLNLSLAYLFRFGVHHSRSLDWLAKGALLNDAECIFNFADVLFDYDNFIYESDPSKWKRYYQNPEWIKAAKVFLRIDEERIYTEQLIVSSLDRIDDVFLTMAYVLERFYEIEELRKAIFSLYLRIVNKSNSYVRGKAK